jgi:hypothetical protein
MYLFGSAADTLHYKCIYPLARARAQSPDSRQTVARQSPASCLDGRAKRCNKTVDSHLAAQLLSAYAVTSRLTTKESTMSTIIIWAIALTPLAIPVSNWWHNRGLRR